jgi:hypothetical protein
MKNTKAHTHTHTCVHIIYAYILCIYYIYSIYIHIYSIYIYPTEPRRNFVTKTNSISQLKKCSQQSKNRPTHFNK